MPDTRGLVRLVRVSDTSRFVGLVPVSDTFVRARLAANRHLNSSARWAARVRVGKLWPAADARRPSPPLPLVRGAISTPTSASAKRTPPRRPTGPMPIAAARAAAIRRPRKSPSLTTGLTAPHTKDPGSTASRAPWVRAPSMRPRESEGSRRRTKMTTGQSGAKAPDRNRGRSCPR